MRIWVEEASYLFSFLYSKVCIHKIPKAFFVQQFHRKMKVFSWKIYLEVAKFKIGNRYARSIFFLNYAFFLRTKFEEQTHYEWKLLTFSTFYRRKYYIIIISQICKKMKLQNSSWDKTKPIIWVNSLHFCNNLLHLFKDLEKTSNDCNRLQMQVMHVQISSR